MKKAQQLQRIDFCVVLIYCQVCLHNAANEAENMEYKIYIYSTYIWSNLFHDFFWGCCQTWMHMYDVHI